MCFCSHKENVIISTENSKPWPQDHNHRLEFHLPSWHSLKRWTLKRYDLTIPMKLTKFRAYMSFLTHNIQHFKTNLFSTIGHNQMTVPNKLNSVTHSQFHMLLLALNIPAFPVRPLRSSIHCVFWSQHSIYRRNFTIAGSSYSVCILCYYQTTNLSHQKAFCTWFLCCILSIASIKSFLYLKCKLISLFKYCVI